MPRSKPVAVPSDPLPIPTHIGIIMDGNSRWAKARHLPRKLGHRQGGEALRGIVRACPDMGVKYLTVYAFSAENWNRPYDEVSDLMGLLRHYIERDFVSMRDEGVCIRIIGDRARLPEDLQDDLQRIEEETTHNEALHFTVALSYGSRQELAMAARELARKAVSGDVDIEAMDEHAIALQLYTHGLPDPDLIIRTGGEKRLSNFLLWQSAYAELYFTDLLWPDFGPDHLKQAILDYGQRERRYGSRT